MKKCLWLKNVKSKHHRKNYPKAESTKENPDICIYLNSHTHITCHLVFSNLSDANPKTRAIIFFF